MRFTDVLTEINRFWIGAPLAFQGGGEAQVQRIQALFTQPLPKELQAYIGRVLPQHRISFQTVGNPLEVYGLSELSTDFPGYSSHAISGKPCEDWNASWLLIADEGADPVIVDLAVVTEHSGYCPVFQAIHGIGRWEFFQIADSLTQFLLLAALRHHALTAFGNVIIDDEFGFRLAEPAANWLFPRIKQTAPQYYSLWLESFGNK